MGGWDIDTLWEAFLYTLAGIPVLFISLHLMNATAVLSGRLAKVTLGKLDSSGDEGYSHPTADGERPGSTDKEN